MTYFVVVHFVRKWVGFSLLPLLLLSSVVAFAGNNSLHLPRKNLWKIKQSLNPADSHIPILFWDFDDEDSDPSNSGTEINQSFGALSITASTGTTPGFASDGNTGQALYYTSWDAMDLYYEIQFSAKAYQNLILSFDHRRTDTGPESFSVEYSIDGGESFVTLAGTETGISIGTGFSNSQFDLSSITELNGNKNIIIRLATINPASGASGRFYLDNLTIEAEPIVPTQLAIVSVNGGELPVKSGSFDIIVEAQNAFGLAGLVTADTELEMLKISGDGSGDISSGGTSTIFANTFEGIVPITYDEDETNVVFEVQTTSGDNLTSYQHDPVTIIDTEPAFPVSSLNTNTIGLNAIELTWIRNANPGEGVIIIAREDEAVDVAPEDGVSYDADPDFGSGDELGNENFVVYSGTGTTTTVTGLNPSNTYYFSAFEYNGENGTENYLPDPVAASAKTCIRPNGPPTDILFTNVSTNSFTISWNNVDNQYAYVLMNSIDQFTAPSDGVDPPLDNNIWSGNGEQLVYAGTASQVNISGIGSLEDYYFRIYAYNCTGTDLQYSNDFTAFTYKTALFYENFSTCPLLEWNTILINGNKWSCGNGNASITGIDGETVTESWLISDPINLTLIDHEMLSFEYFYSGTDNGTSFPQLKVLYSEDYAGSGNPHSYTWEELEFSAIQNINDWQSSGFIDLSQKSTSNAYIAFQYQSSGTTEENATEWKIDNVLIEERECTLPVQQVSDIMISNLGTDQATINWTNGSGFGRVAVVSNSNQINNNPSDGSSYSGNATYGSGEDLGNGHYVVYSGTGNKVDVTGLDLNTEHSVKVFEYNKCAAAGSGLLYNASNANGNPHSFTTQNAQLSDIIINDEFVYPTPGTFSYLDYQGYSLDAGNSISLWEFTIRDLNSDGKSTLLSSLDIEIEGFENLNKVALYDGANELGEIDAANNISFENIDLEVADSGTKTFSLRVTFKSEVIDNEQIKFTITGAEGGDAETYTAFNSPNAGGASSSVENDHNRIEVTADRLAFSSTPNNFYTNVPFSLAISATDASGSIDTDATGSVSLTHDGSGTLDFGEPTSLINGGATFSNITYNKQESIDILTVSDFTNEASTGNQSFERVLAVYDFTGYQDENDGDFLPSWQGENLVSDFSLGSDANPLPFPAFDVFSAKSFSSSITKPTDNYYLELKITPTSAINISGLKFRTQRSGSGPQNLVLRSDQDDFAANINNQIIDISESFQTVSFALTGYENISGEVNFRLYLYNGSHGNGTVQIDDLVVLGEKVDDASPTFISGYPKTELITTNSIDFLASANEEGNLYYSFQTTGSTAPTSEDILNDFDGSLTIEDPDTEYSFFKEALSSSQSYDFYFVLEDLYGNYSATPVLLNAVTANSNSDITAPINIPQIPSGVISSVKNSSNEKVDVFAFTINDNGSGASNDDGLSTKVNKLVIKPGSSNEANWSNVVEGVAVRNAETATQITIQDTLISETAIELTFDENALTIPNDESVDLILSIWLKETLNDNEVLQFSIPDVTGNAHDCMSLGQNSSQFSTVFPNEVASNTFTIDVIADQLSFSDYPGNVTGSFGVTVSATDQNGNIDLDLSGDVSLSKYSGEGNLTVTNATKTLSGGVVVWTDELDYIGATDYFSIAASIDEAELSGTFNSGLISAGGADLTIKSGETFIVENDLSVNGNVVVENNAALILREGASLYISGDLQNQGTITDEGGTFHFNGTTTQTISSIGVLQFNNLTISNTTSVLNESDINLINTLKLNVNAVFDTDGAGDDKELVLVSNASGTARIAKVESGASLNGEVTLQRFIHHQPAKGWYFLTTPIKNQDVTDWQDDLRIQGLGNSNPNAPKVLFYYNEDNSTNTLSGSDGWLPVMSSTETTSGRPLDLFIFNSAFKGGSLTIDNKGEPFIGDGNSVDGTLEVPLDYTSTSFDGGGWNLVVNPYPCEIDWRNVIVSSGVTNAYYMWNPLNGNYTTYVDGITLNESLPYIASGRAFFVKANEAGQSITFSEDAKSSANGNTFLRTKEPDNLIKIELSGPAGAKDEMAIRLDENATSSFDPGLDAQKMKSSMCIYSKGDDNQSLAVNTIPANAGLTTIPLAIDLKEDGVHRIRIKEVEKLSENRRVYFNDNVEDKYFEISSDTMISYFFRKDQQASYKERFELVLTAPVNFELNANSGRPGDQVEVSFNVENFKKVSASNMVFGWNPEELAFEGLANMPFAPLKESDFDLSDIVKGKIVLNWNGADQHDLEDGSTFFSIKFKILANVDECKLEIPNESLSFKSLDGYEFPVLLNSEGIIDINKKGLLSGKITDEINNPIADVELLLSGSDTLITHTATTGDYSLDIFQNETYEISAEANDSDKPEGIDILDISLLRRYLSGKGDLANPFRIVAADVDQSGSIEENDITAMKDVILGKSEDFSFREDWIILPSNGELLVDPLSHSEFLAFEYQDELSLDFTAVKPGDLDLSYDQPDQFKSEIPMLITKHSPSNGESNMVFQLLEEVRISSYQLEIHYDPDLIDVFQVDNALQMGMIDYHIIKPGTLVIIWESGSENPILSDPRHDGLFEISYRTKENTPENTSLFSVEMHSSFAVNDQLEKLRFSSDQNITGFEDEVSSFQLLQNTPNPVQDQTNISFFIPEREMVNFKIIDAVGKTIYEMEKEFDAGWNDIDANVKSDFELGSGVYLYSISAGQYSGIKKMIIE